MRRNWSAHVNGADGIIERTARALQRGRGEGLRSLESSHGNASRVVCSNMLESVDDDVCA